MSDDIPSAQRPIGACAAAEPTTSARRPVRSYVLRGGRIGSGQQRALAQWGPRWCVPFDATVHDWDARFGRRAPRVLEVGFGMGQATAAIALARPEIDFIGVEVHEAGVGALLREVGERGLTNVRIVRHDAVEVLRQMVAPQSLAGVQVFFPDPWPKLRHHKRRLVQAAFAELVADRLQPGGWLHCATDWADYAQQMLAVLSACPKLVNSGDGFVQRPETRPLTKFEARGLRLGHGVWDVLFSKRLA